MRQAAVIEVSDGPQVQGGVAMVAAQRVMAVEDGQVEAPVEFEERHSDLRVKKSDSGLILGGGTSGIEAKSADDFKMFGRCVLKDREDEGKFG